MAEKCASGRQHLDPVIAKPKSNIADLLAAGGGVLFYFWGVGLCFKTFDLILKEWEFSWNRGAELLHVIRTFHIFSQAYSGHPLTTTNSFWICLGQEMALFATSWTVEIALKNQQSISILGRYLQEETNVHMNHNVKSEFQVLLSSSIKD